MKSFTLETSADTAAYDYLSRLSPDRWAWEYLRRNEAFRADAALRGPEDISERKAPCADIRILRPRVSQALAERWGLAFMPSPGLNGFEADAVWSHYVFPDQFEVACTPRRPGEACDVFERGVMVCDVTHITDRHAREYLLVRRQGRVLQVRCTGMSLLSQEPARMKPQLASIDRYRKRLVIQNFAHRLYARSLKPAAARWTKTTQILRNGLIALDGQKAGLSQREIACLMHGHRLVAEGWGSDTSTLRASVRYLLRKAEALREGGYLTDLLDAPAIQGQRAA